ncbi:c-type cytochrome [Shewanella surugensis]|uniref:C-type cytochrome n=1 Tax=Shewanella surugensis TaxID=212020 RepID=A0ABT0LDW5_9GAMM|nr:c-type cytochrome [Shewanella surugensis]MCL1125898.1 c-type cytochrome [Shewanella surugensis]
MIKKSPSVITSLLIMVNICGVAQATSSDNVSLITQTREHAHYACAECHAIDGNPPITNQYHKQSPTLAGQNTDYLQRQLLAFKSGARQTDEMKAVMMDYSPSEIHQIATYFSMQTLQINKNIDPTIDTLIHSRHVDAIWASKGEKLYQEGDEKRDIAPCKSCHGSYGEGSPQKNAPQLTAQHARYIRMTLQHYQQGKRTTDKSMGSPMQMITKKLSDNEIRELAAYIQRMKTAPKPVIMNPD